VFSVRRIFAFVITIIALFVASAFVLPCPSLRAQSSPQQDRNWEVVVYGSTPAGIVAAIQLAKWNHHVLLLEPSGHLGGMTTGGLGATDIGNKSVIGGMSREFYAKVYDTYQSPRRWRFESAKDFQSSRQQSQELTQWTFEPHVAAEIFENWLIQSKVTYRLNAKLDRSQSITLRENRLDAIPLRGGEQISARYFIDATYEGDLLAFHLAIEKSTDLQSVEYARLQSLLNDLGQVLAWESRIP